MADRVTIPCCSVVGCGRFVVASKLFCAYHERLVPRATQDALYRRASQPQAMQEHIVLESDGLPAVDDAAGNIAFLKSLARRPEQRRLI